MFQQLTRLGIALVALASLSLSALADDLMPSTNNGDAFEEVVVQGVSSLQQRLGDSGSISVIDAQTIQDVAATHPSEVLNRVPGVWVNRGSGQEHPHGDTFRRLHRFWYLRVCSAGKWHTAAPPRFL